MSAAIASLPSPVMIPQRTPEWHAARCGHITASRLSDVAAAIQKGEAAARRNYRAELVAERLTKIPTSHFVSREMQWGIDQEPFARAAYEVACDVMVDTAGFVLHSVLPLFGASSDGLVGDDGLIQIKCPNTSTHLGWMREGTVPLEHMPQMIAEMDCYNRGWCDFVSFDPRLPADLRLFIPPRFSLEDNLIECLRREVVGFNAEIEEEIAILRKVPVAMRGGLGRR